MDRSDCHHLENIHESATSEESAPSMDEEETESGTKNARRSILGVRHRDDYQSFLQKMWPHIHNEDRGVVRDERRQRRHQAVHDVVHSVSLGETTSARHEMNNSRNQRKILQLKEDGIDPEGDIRDVHIHAFEEELQRQDHLVD